MYEDHILGRIAVLRRPT